MNTVLSGQTTCTDLNQPSLLADRAPLLPVVRRCEARPDRHYGSPTVYSGVRTLAAIRPISHEATHGSSLRRGDRSELTGRIVHEARPGEPRSQQPCFPGTSSVTLVSLIGNGGLRIPLDSYLSRNQLGFQFLPGLQHSSHRIRVVGIVLPKSLDGVPGHEVTTV